MIHRSKYSEGYEIYILRIEGSEILSKKMRELIFFLWNEGSEIFARKNEGSEIYARKNEGSENLSHFSRKHSGHLFPIKNVHITLRGGKSENIVEMIKTLDFDHSLL